MNKNIKKILTTIIVMTSVLITGCYSEISVSIDEIEKDIQNILNDETMVKGDVKTLRRYYGLNPNDLEDFILYTPKSTMDVTEVLILKVKNLEQVQLVEETIDSRVDKQLKNFEGYGIEQTALLQDYEIKVDGKYVFFAVSDKAQEIKDKYKQIIKE